MNIQVHKESGLSVRDSQSNALLYQDSFENAVLDADLEQTSWPDQSIVRVFSLADGRVAIVRETEAGLRQEEASAAQEAFLNQFANKSSLLIEAKASREASESSESL